MKIRSLDVLVVVVTVLAGIALPYGFALFSEFAWEMVSVSGFLNVIYGFDFITRYVRLSRRHGKLSLRLQAIFYVNRLETFIEFLAAMPFFLLAIHFDFYWLGLIPLLKIHRVARILAAAQDQKALNPVKSRLVVFGFILVMVTHLISCGWIDLGAVEVEPGESIYIKALYWAVTTLTTVGYGDITPNTDLERLYTMAVMILGAGSYGFLIGNLASLLSNIDVARAGFLARMGDVDSFLRYKSVPKDLRQRVRNYYNYIWDSRMAHDEATILADLMPSLRFDLMLSMHRNLIEKVPFFRNSEEGFLREVIPCLKPEVMLPSDTIFHHGQTGDCMYFIGHGSVEIIAKDGEEVLTVLEDGGYFGELALIEDATRAATAKAADYCILYRLERQSLDALFKTHPDFAAHVFETMKEYKHTQDAQ